MRAMVWGSRALFVTMTLAGCMGDPEDLADGFVEPDGVRADQDVVAVSQALIVPNFCESFIDPFGAAPITHSTTALCLNETVTNPDTLDYDVTMSFPDFAGSWACAGEHVRLRVITQTSSSTWATIFDAKAPAKIVGSKCLARMTISYFHVDPAVRFNSSPDPIAANIKTTGTVTPW
jgi:hypothetical protein